MAKVLQQRFSEHLKATLYDQQSSGMNGAPGMDLRTVIMESHDAIANFEFPTGNSMFFSIMLSINNWARFPGMFFVVSGYFWPKCVDVKEQVAVMMKREKAKVELFVYHILFFRFFLKSLLSSRCGGSAHQESYCFCCVCYACCINF